MKNQTERSILLSQQPESTIDLNQTYEPFFSGMDETLDNVPSDEEEDQDDNPELLA
jgi:hypothetical protein